MLLQNVAQLEERKPATLDVVGANPIVQTKRDTATCLALWFSGGTADAPVSNTGSRKGVRVQIPPEPSGSVAQQQRRLP